MREVYIILVFHDGVSAISEPSHLFYFPNSRLNYPERATRVAKIIYGLYLQCDGIYLLAPMP